MLCCPGGSWGGCEPLTAPLQAGQQLCLPSPPAPDVSSSLSSALTHGRKLGLQEASALCLLHLESGCRVLFRLVVRRVCREVRTLAEGMQWKSSSSRPATRGGNHTSLSRLLRVNEITHAECSGVSLVCVVPGLCSCLPLSSL